MKKLCSLLILAVCLSFTSCGTILNVIIQGTVGKSGSSGTSSSGSSGTATANTIDKSYWGTWQRMDTGDYYYIDSTYVYKGSEPSSYRSDIYHNGAYYGMSDYVFDGDNIVAKKSGSDTEFLMFRVGGSAKSFSATLSGFSDSRDIGSRAVASASDYKGKRTNPNNTSDTQEVTPSSDGTINFTGAVAGDTQQITITGTDVGQTVSVDVVPEYDGENIGSIPVINAGEYGFKSSCNVSKMYAGSSTTLNITMTNIGESKCSQGMYEISSSDTNAVIGETNSYGTYSTISPGSSKTISVSFSYPAITKSYVDVPIKILMEDAKSSDPKAWEDTVYVRVLRGCVTMTVSLKSIDSYSNNKLQGFIIYPNGNSQHFTISSSNKTVKFPWSDEDYIIVFSGATVSSELFYSFSFSGTPEDLTNAGSGTKAEVQYWYTKMRETPANDSYSSATTVSDLTSPVTGYLADGDVDFYRVNVKSVELSN